MSQGLELFTAITFDRGTLDSLNLASRLIRQSPDAWQYQMEKEQHYHLTLNHMPFVKDVEYIKSQLQEIRSNEIQLRLSKIGTFQNEKENVIWVGVEGEMEKLSQLKNDVDEACKSVVISRQSCFRPHITMAYAKSPHSLVTVPRMLPKEMRTGFQVNEFRLFQVVHTDGRIEFLQLASYPLGVS